MHLACQSSTGDPKGDKWTLTGTRVLDWALLAQWWMQMVRVLLKNKKQNTAHSYTSIRNFKN